MTTGHKRPPSETGTFWVIRNADDTGTWMPDPGVFCAYTSSDLAMMVIAELKMEGYVVTELDWPMLVANYREYFDKVLIDYFPGTSMGHLYDLKL